MVTISLLTQKCWMKEYEKNQSADLMETHMPSCTHKSAQRSMHGQACTHSNVAVACGWTHTHTHTCARAHTHWAQVLCLIVLPSVILPSGNWKHLPQPLAPITNKTHWGFLHTTQSIITNRGRATNREREACCSFWHNMKRTHSQWLVEGQIHFSKKGKEEIYVSLTNRRSTCPWPIHKSLYSELKSLESLLVPGVFLSPVSLKFEHEAHRKVNQHRDGQMKRNSHKANNWSINAFIIRLLVCPVTLLL